MTPSVDQTIQHIYTEDVRIWSACENIYNLYDNDKNAEYYISKDSINDLMIAKVTRDSDFDVVLGCQDSCIRILQNGNLFLEIPTDAPVTALAFMEIEGSDAAGLGVKGPTAIIYGLATGK